MPEYPDITVYMEALERRVVGRVLERIQILDMFVLRTAVPPVNSLEGRKVERLRRVGKRIALRFEGERWLVMHLMIAGRLQWADAGTRPTARNALARLVFEDGLLTLTEAGRTRRAALHVVEGEEGLRAHDPGGIEVMEADAQAFTAALTRENHTLKRALTDPRTFGRDFARGEAVAGGADAETGAGRDRSIAGGGARGVDGVDGAIAEGGERGIPGESDGVSPGDGGAR